MTFTVKTKEELRRIGKSGMKNWRDTPGEKYQDEDMRSECCLDEREGKSRRLGSQMVDPWGLMESLLTFFKKSCHGGYYRKSRMLLSWCTKGKARRTLKPG